MRINPKDILLVSTQFLLFIVFTIDLDWSLGCSHLIKMIGLIVSLLLIVLSILRLYKKTYSFLTFKTHNVLL